VLKYHQPTPGRPKEDFIIWFVETVSSIEKHLACDLQNWDNMFESFYKVWSWEFWS
jgi:hypothetical protein